MKHRSCRYLLLAITIRILLTVDLPEESGQPSCAASPPSDRIIDHATPVGVDEPFASRSAL